MNLLIIYRQKRKGRGTIDKPIKVPDVIDRTHGLGRFFKHMAEKKYQIINIFETE